MSNTVSTQMPDKRLRVAVTIDTHVKGWERIAPRSQHDDHPQVGQCEFFLNPKEEIDVDYWIICANARPKESMRCAPENTLFIAGEPESKKIYPKAFYRQFYRVIDTHLKSEHPRVTLHAPCLSWHVGRNHRLGIFEKGYSELMAMECPTTPQNKISVVCSNAAFTEGQRRNSQINTGRQADSLWARIPTRGRQVNSNPRLPVPSCDGKLPGSALLDGKNIRRIPRLGIPALHRLTQYHRLLPHQLIAGT
jgi:hypothetical protein